jgi:hypothetical protein
MGYRILADALVVFHMAFLVFVVVGGGLVLWRRRMAFLHLPVLAWGIYIEWSGAVCPLTPLEQKARSAGGEAGYSGGFIDHYLVPILYPPGLDRSHQIWLGTLVLGFNIVVYGFVARRWMAKRRDATPEGGG